jgi:hypothetical protein
MLKWKLISVHLQIVLFLTQDRRTVCVERPLPQKSFLTHPMELLGAVGHLQSRFGPFGDGVSVHA